MHHLQYWARPSHPTYGEDVLLVHCWIKTKSKDVAVNISTQALQESDWEVLNLEQCRYVSSPSECTSKRMLACYWQAERGSEAYFFEE